MSLSISEDLKIQSQDEKTFTNSSVDVDFAGYRPMNFEKLSTTRMTDLMPNSSSVSQGYRQIILRGVTLYK